MGPTWVQGAPRKGTLAVEYTRTLGDGEDGPYRAVALSLLGWAPTPAGRRVAVRLNEPLSRPAAKS